jgi:uncharacterized membrane protein
MLETRAVVESRRFAVRSVTLARPFAWLAAGWRDFMVCPLPGLLHGAALAVFGSLMFWTARQYFWLLAGSFSGFLLVAPVLATGLYAISRAIERGERADLGVALGAWQPTDRRPIVFGVLLALAGTGWVVTSAALIRSFATAPVLNPADFIRVVVAASHGGLFELWLAVGGVLAAPVFASSVVALPMLIERDVGVLAAVLTSWRCVLANPGPLALWAAVLMLLTLAGMVTAMLGLLVVVPWLGHASWHAYRDLVEPATPTPAR